MGLTSWEKGKLQYKPGDVYQGVDYQMYRMGDTIGHLKAIDVATKKVVWDVPSPLPLFSGMLATKGGVLFTGDQRGRFLAFNSKTGKELWKFQTGSGINASPITYELDGKQYVAILSGLGGDPSFYYSAPKGGMLWVFAIDGKVDEGGRYNAQVIEKMLPASSPERNRASSINPRCRPVVLLAAPIRYCPRSRQCRGGVNRPLSRPAGRHRRRPRHLRRQVLYLPSQRRRARAEPLRHQAQRRTVPGDCDPRPQEHADAGVRAAPVAGRGVAGPCVHKVDRPLLRGAISNLPAFTSVLGGPDRRSGPAP